MYVLYVLYVQLITRDCFSESILTMYFKGIPYMSLSTPIVPAVDIEQYLSDNLNNEMFTIVTEACKNDSFIAGGAALAFATGDVDKINDLDIYHQIGPRTGELIRKLIHRKEGYFELTAKYNGEGDRDTSILFIMNVKTTKPCEFDSLPCWGKAMSLQFMFCMQAVRDIYWFDISCCSVFYHDDQLQAFWPEDIKNRVFRTHKFVMERLSNGDYIQLDRIKKYSKKGFQWKGFMDEEMPLVEKFIPEVEVMISLMRYSNLEHVTIPIDFTPENVNDCVLKMWRCIAIPYDIPYHLGRMTHDDRIVVAKWLKQSPRSSSTGDSGR